MKLNYQRKNGANDGTFLDRDITVGRLGTVIDAETFNQIITETNNLIEGAGLTPSKSELNQLITAIKKIQTSLSYSKKEIDDKLNLVEQKLSVGSVIPIHYIGSTSETVDKKTPIPNYGTWEKISSAGFLRFKSDNANESRQTNGYQGDAIRNMVGTYRSYCEGNGNSSMMIDIVVDGVFARTGVGRPYVSMSSHGGSNYLDGIDFNASRVVPTSNTENRVANEGTWEFWKRVS